MKRKRKNLRNRRVVIPTFDDGPLARDLWRKASNPCPSEEEFLAPLEARALIVKHAFETMGMERIWASNCFPGLIKWVLKYQSLGFKVEGFAFDSFRKGEFVVLIKSNKHQNDDLLVEELFHHFAKYVPNKELIQSISKITGNPKNKIYKIFLTLFNRD